MRDPNRIDEFCTTLAELWHKVPDWRFGQLIMNALQKMSLQTIFYMEDEAMLKEMKNYFNEVNNK
jgi:hypothetical protein